MKQFLIAAGITLGVLIFIVVMHLVGIHWSYLLKQLGLWIF